MTRPRIDEATAFKNAVKRFKVLVTYFDVTRPQYDSAFKDKNGRFSRDIISRKMKFLSEWNPRKRHYDWELIRYDEYSSDINYAFGIPSELVKKILGSYRDENCVQHKISVKKVENHLLKDGWLKKVVKAGAKLKNVDDGGLKKKYWWHKKYLMDEKVWNGLLDDPRYSDYTTYPSRYDPQVQDAISTISEWRNSMQSYVILKDMKKDGDIQRAHKRMLDAGLTKLAEDLMNSIKKRGKLNEIMHWTEPDR